MIALIGAKPVPEASSTIGLSLSSRRKKLPNGPSMRRMSFSFIALKTWSVNLPPGMWRTCSSIDGGSPRLRGRVGHRVAAPRAVAQDELDVLAGAVLQGLVGRQLQPHHRHVGRRRASMASTRHGIFSTGYSPAPGTVRASITQSVCGVAQQVRMQAGFLLGRRQRLAAGARRG